MHYEKEQRRCSSNMQTSYWLHCADTIYCSAALLIARSSDGLSQPVPDPKACFLNNLPALYRLVPHASCNQSIKGLIESNESGVRALPARNHSSWNF